MGGGKAEGAVVAVSIEPIDVPRSVGASEIAYHRIGSNQGGEKLQTAVWCFFCGAVFFCVFVEAPSQERKEQLSVKNDQFGSSHRNFP